MIRFALNLNESVFFGDVQVTIKNLLEDGPFFVSCGSREIIQAVRSGHKYHVDLCVGDLKEFQSADWCVAAFAYVEYLKT